MRGSTLSKILNDFRAEARLSLSEAHNVQVRAAHVVLLQTAQSLLWEDYPWAHLVVRREIPTQAGQRFYEPPPDMSLDRVSHVDMCRGQRWVPLTSGIPDGLFAHKASDFGVRGDDPSRWRVVEEGLELWPVPARDANLQTRDGMLRLTGVRNLKPFVQDDDRADLDDRLIVLHAAGEFLASIKSPDAQLKMDQATRLYYALRGRAQTTPYIKLYGGRR